MKTINKSKTLFKLGVGNKEPNRDDFTESSPESRPQHEQLLDVEFGHRYTSEKLSISTNFYNMQYKNQLILTGELNDVGSAVRVNIPESYRRGVEFTGAAILSEKFTLKFNLTLSENKISTFTEYVDNWDTWGKDEVVHENTDIAFSPGIIGGGQLIFTPFEKENGKLQFALLSKYVGNQYIDNTSSDFAKLDAYLVHDLRISYLIKSNLFREVEVSSWIRNLSNQNYISNAWVYRFNTAFDPTSYDMYANPENGNTDNQIGAFNLAGIFAFAPAAFAADRAMEAADAVIKTCVAIVDGIPSHDMIKIKRYMRRYTKSCKMTLVGPNCAGIISPGKSMLGIMPGHIYKEGRIGIISRSGTLGYEAAQQLKNLNIGVSTSVGIGGDPINGSSFRDIIEKFETDSETDAILMIGEIGGPQEVAAGHFAKENMKKPVIAYIAGLTAPKGRVMGHAGAIVSAYGESAVEKVELLKECGVTISKNPSVMGDTVKKVLGKS